MLSPAQCPLFIAALVALCGIGLIVFGSLWPAGTADGEAGRSPREHLHKKHLQALAELRKFGLSGAVDVIDFGDGLGLGAAQSIEANAVLMRVPEALSLDVARVRHCARSEADEGEPALDCQIEQKVVEAVSKNEVSRLTGLLSLLVMERRRGLVTGLPRNAASEVLKTLPEPEAQAANGLFAIDGEEFRIFSRGTSMEGWHAVAVKDTTQAHDFIRASLHQLGDVSLDEVKWAYLVLHFHAQWAGEDGLDDGLELPPQVYFLWPLFLARPTPEWQHGVHLRHNAQSHTYEVVTSHAMHAGDEVHFVDRRLSDASVMCFQGLWLTGRHRMRLSLNVSAAKRDPPSQPILQKYGCGAQPLRLYVSAQKNVDQHFISCMRMLALASNVSKLTRAEQKGWMHSWPVTEMAGKKVEATAVELAIGSLQQVLSRLGSSSAEMRQRFGNDAAAKRPSVQVREAETMIVVGLLKSMKELQLVASNEYLYEALHESSGKASSAGARGAGASAGGAASMGSGMGGVYGTGARSRDRRGS